MLLQHNSRFLRHELKFLITYADYYSLKSSLCALLEPDENSDEDGYTIRSLYFDDIHDSAYVDKESGLGRRRKHRIRIYNYSDSVIKYEIKDKFGDYISKISAPISRSQCACMINTNFDFMIDSDYPTLRAGYIDARCSLIKPRVIVDYEREAYVCESGNVRITFDRDIRAGIDSFDIFDEGVITVPTLAPGTLVLEVKYDDFLPSFIRKELKRVDKRPMAISKYVLCRKAKELYYRREIPYESVFTVRPVKFQ